MPDRDELSRLERLLTGLHSQSRVEQIWAELSAEFTSAQLVMPVQHMTRTELSFHPHVKLLAYLAMDTKSLDGALLEIGVWKGKSLALMSRAADRQALVVGIDPCELEGQRQDLAYFHEKLFPECCLIEAYSHFAFEQAQKIAPKVKLLHIDGMHHAGQVWADFLLYERLVVESGYIVFDDYTDAEFSPEVGPAVDRLRAAGLFSGYVILGQLPGFEASYVLRRCVAA